MSSYVIIDLEMCPVPKALKNKENPLRSELIQIGAVLLDENLEISDTFSTFVCPQLGKIDPFIQKLTGISQKDVFGAPKFKEALDLFTQWMPNDAQIVAWSDSDAGQIKNEMEYKGLSIENINPDKWIDCQKSFSEKMHTEKVYRLSEAISIADIYYDEDFHNALVDAKNTALLFAKMQREPELVLSPYYTITD